MHWWHSTCDFGGLARERTSVKSSLLDIWSYSGSYWAPKIHGFIWTHLTWPKNWSIQVASTWMAILTKDLKKLGKAAFFWIALVFFYHQYVLLQPTASQESELVHQESAQLTRSHSINDEWRDFWKWTQSSSSAHHLYSADFDWAAVNKGLATANIQKVYSFSSDDDELGDIFPKLKSSDFGSAYKWILVLDGGQIAIFKPQWWVHFT